MEGKANPRFESALAFAAEAHGAVKQQRKGTDFPYIAHPIRVAEILDRFEYNEDVIVAGFLHDTIEDAKVTREQIGTKFGPHIASLVTSVSEPDKSIPWRKRKEHSIERLEQEPDPDVHALLAADKLDNVRSITDTLRHLGQKKTWDLFNAERSDQHWYYRSIADVLLRYNPESRLFRTLDFETQTLFPDARHSTNFFAGKPLGTPHDARAYLADPIKHWRPEHSALELATIWIGARGFPPSVVDVLGSSNIFAGCTLIEGFFEREVELGTKGRPSQTDLLALVQLADGYGVIAVEGKARESFGPLVSEWNDGPGKQARLDDLCKGLGLEASDVGDLHYQLLHRTVSALLEARRYGAREALMLVHSFDPDDSSLDAYQAFAAALGLTNAVPNAITNPTMRDDIGLQLGWVKEC
jgi:HD domain